MSKIKVFDLHCPFPSLSVFPHFSQSSNTFSFSWQQSGRDLSYLHSCLYSYPDVQVLSVLPSNPILYPTISTFKIITLQANSFVHLNCSIVITITASRGPFQVTQPKDIYFLTALEARSLKSRSQ